MEWTAVFAGRDACVAPVADRIRRRRAIPKGEVFAIFATAPVVDPEELRADLDEEVSQELRDPYAGTGLRQYMMLV